ncbi:citryl-CoA lyase [Roseomonas sp. KE2513]|uniref:citryl-CoA lyase n=1 Tax=Roseomonas sp. KE2513 TaxID=2479202 RepID=UPI0018E0368B|nr:citryl-CoA lyase [Roseomonas sp. KE2513]MBI0538583.1 citryl-CoA lyase [Roseomonas sp. KE2513]
MRATDLVSGMGRSTPDRIWVQGRDLCRDLLGKVSLSDMAWLEITGREPTPGESKVFDALLVVLVEHGMTPMAIATRLTYLGAPESLQAAVAAGLCGMGTTFAGTAEGAAKLLQEALRDAPAEADLAEMARGIVAERFARKAVVPGIGHPLHKPVDPRAPVLFALAEEHHIAGRHVALMQEVSRAAEASSGKSLPVNATGALGAIASDMGLDWRLCRGLAVIGRAVGLVGHIAEELRQPIAREVWLRVEEETARNAAKGEDEHG